MSIKERQACRRWRLACGWLRRCRCAHINGITDQPGGQRRARWVANRHTVNRRSTVRRDAEFTLSFFGDRLAFPPHRRHKTCRRIAANVQGDRLPYWQRFTFVDRCRLICCRELERWRRSPRIDSGVQLTSAYGLQERGGIGDGIARERR